MGENLPTIRITPAIAVRFARKIRLRVTKEEAREWLNRYRTEIERRLMDTIPAAIHDALAEVTVWEWPEPAFDKMYRLVDVAVSEAVEQHVKSPRPYLRSHFCHEEDMYRIVRFFMRGEGRKPRAARLVVLIFSTVRNRGRSGNTAQVSNVIDLVYANDKVTATVRMQLPAESVVPNL